MLDLIAGLLFIISFAGLLAYWDNTQGSPDTFWQSASRVFLCLVAASVVAGLFEGALFIVTRFL